MDLEDLVEGHIAGEHPEVPDELRRPFERAMAAHEALRSALDETPTREADPADRTPPELPDDYEVVRELGRGGMGVVYLVRQGSLGRLAAVKVLRPAGVASGPTTRRLLEEARHLARLRHPHIVAVHEVGRDGRGEPYFTMDYIDGEPLSALLGRGRLTPSQSLAILNPVAGAVRHAHEHGVIHRDLKPGNILLDGAGTAIVTDFGLARDLARADGLTRPGEMMGTPAYMAPEQARGQAGLVGEATDVHALGAIFYEMLSGRPPYGNDAPADILARLLRDDPTPPTRLDRRVPRDLEAICLKALAKEPARRYATVAALIEDLRRFEAGVPPLARRSATSDRAWRWLRRHRRPLAAAGATAAVAAAAAAIVVPRLVRDSAIRPLLGEAGWSHQSGRHDAAVRLYASALDQIDQHSPRTVAALRAEDEPADRLAILREVRRCVGEIDDPEVAAEVALSVVAKTPWISFGSRDLAVARLAVRRAEAFGVRPWPGGPEGGPDPQTLEALYLLQLAGKRLDLFAGVADATPGDRREADRLRSTIRAMQDRGGPPPR